MSAPRSAFVAWLALTCITGCARKQVESRNPDDTLGEAGGSSPAAGAAGDVASGGSGGRAGEEDAGPSQGGTGAAQLDAGQESVIDELPGIPVPAPGIVGAGALPMGIWIGETNETFGAHYFDCGISSPRVTLRIASADPSGSAAGTIIFGENVPVPPVDPALEYPVGASEEQVDCLKQNVFEGFPYAVRDGQIDDDGRFHFRVAAAEPYAPWCAEQISLPFIEAATGYSCLPYGLPRYREMCASDPECSISLAHYAVCRDEPACTCIEEGCAANLNFVHRFDLQVSGDTMRGVISPPWSELGAIEVSLRKVQ